jgi:hypothetical protein
MVVCSSTYSYTQLSRDNRALFFVELRSGRTEITRPAVQGYDDSVMCHYG